MQLATADPMATRHVAIKRRLKRQRALLLAVLTFVLMTSWHSNAIASTKVYYLGELPGGHDAVPTAISNSGLVVGRGFSTTQTSAILFNVLSGGPNIKLNVSNGWNDARGVNSSGQIIGYEANDPTTPGNALVYDPSGNGNNVDLGSGLRAYAINDNSQVVGGSGNGVNAGAWLWDLSVNTNAAALGQGEAVAISDNGTIVGSSYAVSGDGWHATLYDPMGGGNNLDLGKLLPSDDRSFAYGVNDAGQIVGYSGGPRTGYTATLYDNTGGGNNVALAGVDSYARAINNVGQAVGEVSGRATLFDLTGAMNNFDLNGLVDPTSGWVLFDATGINDLGWIIGRGNYGAFLLAPDDAFPDYQAPGLPSHPDLPEPTSIVVWSLFGFAGSITLQRRSRR